jgi:hypothetical protein
VTDAVVDGFVEDVSAAVVRFAVVVGACVDGGAEVVC